MSVWWVLLAGGVILFLVAINTDNPLGRVVLKYRRADQASERAERVRWCDAWLKKQQVGFGDWRVGQCALDEVLK